MEPDSSPAAAFADRCRFLLAGLVGLGIAGPSMMLITTGMVGFSDTKSALRDWWPQIAVGYVGMTLLLFAASGLCARRVQAAPWWLVPVHWCLFAVGAAAASTANCVWHGGGDWLGWFGKPVFWLLLIGTVPALCIGGIAALFYGWLERRGY